MLTVSKTLSPDKGYSCCFRNHHAVSHCRFLHGYDLRFTIEFILVQEDGGTTSPEGWVIGFGDLGPIKDALEALFDHHVIVAADDPELEAYRKLSSMAVTVLPAVGAEAFASYVLELTEQWLSTTEAFERGVRVFHVTCAENGSNEATAYSAAV